MPEQDWTALCKAGKETNRRVESSLQTVWLGASVGGRPQARDEKAANEGMDTSIECRGATWILNMRKHFPQHGFIRAIDGERRQVVWVKEIHCQSFITGARLALQNPAQKNEFIGMIKLERLDAVGVDHCHYLFGFDAKAAFLPDLAFRHRGGRIAKVCPAARHCPVAIGSFLDEQDLSIPNDRAAHVHFWRDIA